jgi:hypothetical protein
MRSVGERRSKPVADWGKECTFEFLAAAAKLKLPQGDERLWHDNIATPRCATLPLSLSVTTQHKTSTLQEVG